MPAPGRLAVSRELTPLVIDTDQSVPIYLHLDTTREGFALDVRYTPNEPNLVVEWAWQNGRGGAGTTVETEASYQDGACEYGTFVNLRRKGVAQPAGKLVELVLPAGAAGVTTGRLYRGLMYGNDLWIATRSRYLLKVPGAIGDPATGGTTTPITEVDFGASSATTALAVWRHTGATYLEVSDTGVGIHEYNGSTWALGAAGTERGLLATVYWAIGEQLATGGLAGTAGTGGHRLVGTDALGTGFYHVAGDPKVSANWSSLTAVGVAGGTYPIQHLVADNHTAWFSSGIGVLGANSLGYTPNLTKWVENNASLLGGQAAAFWNDLIWFAHPLGLAAFHPDGSRVDFGQFLQFGARAGTTPIYGRPRVVYGTESGLMVGYYNEETATSYIGCLVHDDDGSYRWSMAEAVIEDQEVTFIQQCSGSDTYPRVFIGTLDTSSRLHLYVQWLARSGDPEADFIHTGPYKLAEDWSLRLSRSNGRRAVRKAVRVLTGEFDNLNSTYPANRVDVTMAADGGTFVAQGTATTETRFSTSPDATTTVLTDFQVKLDVHNEGAPVIVRALAVRYSPRPDLTQFITYPVIIAEGATNHQDPKIVISRLEDLIRRGPRAIKNHLGRDVDGMVEPPIPQKWELNKNSQWIVHADVTISVTEDSARWDEALWDLDLFS